MQISQFILYHGSDTNVKLPVWNLGSRYRDFGQCFYTTYDRETAEDWADKMNTRLTLCSRLKTYHQLLTRPHLQEEGSLFICELLEKELAGGK